MTTTRVLILGGGFGGVHTAMALEKLISRQYADRKVELTLVSHDNFFLFTPMLHEVAASDLDITHIVSPLRALLRHTRVFVGDVDAVDLRRQRVSVTHGYERHAHELEYDQLIIGLGSITNFYGLPGLERFTLTMKTLGDAIHLRNRIIATLEEAATECRADHDGLLTFVVVGGGFAGVETMAAINDFVREGLALFPTLRSAPLRMVLVHSGDVILPELGEKLGAYAQRKLADRGVEIVTRARVASASGTDVELADGRRIASRLVVWTAGTSPHPLLHELPCRLDKGRIVVEPTLAVPEWSGVWALGDCAVVPDVRTGRPHPPTAQHAIRQARTAARNVMALVASRPLERFEFTTLGQLAAIGRRTGVARVLGLNFSGFFAWWLWRTVYLGKLPRLEKKIRVAFDWTLDLIFRKDFVQFQAERAPMSMSKPPVSDRADAEPSAGRQADRSVPLEVTR